VRKCNFQKRIWPGAIRASLPNGDDEAKGAAKADWPLPEVVRHPAYVRFAGQTLLLAYHQRFAQLWSKVLLYQYQSMEFFTNYECNAFIDQSYIRFRKRTWRLLC
jgi:hypothetical protein